MKKARFDKYARDDVKSVTDRLANIRLQNNLNNESFATISHLENSAEGYPKLRRPKPTTLLKILNPQNRIDNPSEVSKYLFVCFKNYLIK